MIRLVQFKLQLGISAPSDEQKSYIDTPGSPCILVPMIEELVKASESWLLFTKIVTKR